MRVVAEDSLHAIIAGHGEELRLAGLEPTWELHEATAAAVADLVRTPLTNPTEVHIYTDGSLPDQLDRESHKQPSWAFAVLALNEAGKTALLGVVADVLANSGVFTCRLGPPSSQRHHGARWHPLGRGVDCIQSSLAAW